MATQAREYRWVRDGATGARRMRYGADYNPEQWSRDVWAEDMRLMREAGVNVVSLAIFSWALLEPRPGEYDFAWLDEVIDLLLPVLFYRIRLRRLGRAARRPGAGVTPGGRRTP